MTSPTQNIFELVLARPGLDAAGQESGVVHLWWSAADQGERVVQVYVDGALAEVSVDPTQRELYLLCDRSRSHRVELLAVDAGDADAVWRPRPELLRGWDPPVRGEAAVSLLRDGRLPSDAVITVSLDGKPIDAAPLWPAEELLPGLGGDEDLAGPGLGLGELGLGPLGQDGSAWHWRRDDLPVGTHEVTLAAHDSAGRSVAVPVTIPEVVIDALPPATRELSMSSDFVLTWSV